MRNQSDDRKPWTFVGIIEGDVLADRILAGPVLVSQHLIDDGNLFRGLAVFVGEIAALQKRNTQGGEEIQAKSNGCCHVGAGHWRSGLSLDEEAGRCRHCC